MVGSLPANAGETLVLSLVGKDATCHRITKPMYYDY